MLDQSTGNTNVSIEGSVLRKYQEASRIANSVIAQVMDACQPGARLLDLCELGDRLVRESTQAVYTNKVNGKAISRGIAFPCCVSVNDCLCHFSPISSEHTEDVLAEGDWVKIHLGVHIDGYAALAADTVVVAGSEESSSSAAENAALLEQQREELAKCAHVLECLICYLVQPGKKNIDVARACRRTMDEFFPSLNFIMGTVSHEMRQFVIDGDKMVVVRENPKPTTPEGMMAIEEEDSKVRECTFEPSEVYALDIAVTDGSGIPRDRQERTTVFRRKPDVTYSLKMRSSRQVLQAISSQFSSFPFSIRSLTASSSQEGGNTLGRGKKGKGRRGGNSGGGKKKEGPVFVDEATLKAGMNELKKSGLLTPYYTLHQSHAFRSSSSSQAEEKEGGEEEQEEQQQQDQVPTQILHLQFTYLLPPTGNPVRLTGGSHSSSISKRSIHSNELGAFVDLSRPATRAEGEEEDEVAKDAKEEEEEVDEEVGKPKKKPRMTRAELETLLGEALAFYSSLEGPTAQGSNEEEKQA
jgi:curved DNA binding protein